MQLRTAEKRKHDPQLVTLTDDTDALNADAVALVPGALVAVFSLDLPKGLRGEAREQVARRQLRDLIGLGHDAVQLRPFHDVQGSDSWSRVLVAASADIEGWCMQARDGCRAVLPDYLALPTSPALWTVMGTDTGYLVRLGPQDGFSAPLTLALTLIKRALTEAEERPRAFLLLGTGLQEVEAMAEAEGIEVHKDPSAVGAQILAHGELDFDMRRDPQAARARLRARVLPWRWPVLGALLAAGIWGTTQGVVTRRLETQTTNLNTITMELVRAHFVPIGPVLDVRVQVSRILAQLQATNALQADPISAGPLNLLGRTAEVLVNGQTQLKSANYTQTAGMAIQVILPDFEALDGLIAALDLAGLNVDVAQSRASEHGTEAELRIGWKPS